MSKNKSLVSSANTNWFKIKLVCESARHYLIDMVNFIENLACNKVLISLTGSLWFP